LSVFKVNIGGTKGGGSAVPRGVGDSTSADRYKSEVNSKGGKERGVGELTLTDRSESGVSSEVGGGSATQLSSTRSEFKGQFQSAIYGLLTNDL